MEGYSLFTGEKQKQREMKEHGQAPQCIHPSAAGVRAGQDGASLNPTTPLKLQSQVSTRTCLVSASRWKPAHPGAGGRREHGHLGSGVGEPCCSRARPASRRAFPGSSLHTPRLLSPTSPHTCSHVFFAAYILIFLLLHVAEDVSVRWEAILKRVDTREVGVL